MKKPLLRGYLQGMSPHSLSPHNNPEKISRRVASRLTADHISALFPDVDSPFRDIEDVVDRLLPYHVFQHPREDLLKAGKGKQKATETEILRNEVAGTPALRAGCRVFCPQCIQKQSLRWSALSADENWRNAFVVRGRNLARHALLYTLAIALSLTARRQRTASDDQVYYLEREVLDCERAEHSTLSTDLRNAKSELERVTRLQRVATLPQRTNYYPPTPPIYAHHYRTYHYPYAQTYGVPAGSAAAQGYPYSVPLSSAITQYAPPTLTTTISTTKLSAAGATAATSASIPTTSPLTPASDTSIPVPTPSASGSSSAIPVQLPVSSLPTLHALGIVPVPPQSLSASTPTPQAVLRGTSADGATLHLEINLSLLQAAQMSGLALVLNSILRGSSTTGEVPAHAPVGAPYIYPYTTAQLSATTTATSSSTNTDPNKVTQPQGQEGKT
jgi:hypothetical protein